ncbi:hypothetical protein G9A89_016492 [Geosiphon pyriformis]|nr:hypothetical protein G9A89_016492 [Geosiphon pyriformis]
MIESTQTNILNENSITQIITPRIEIIPALEYYAEKPPIIDPPLNLTPSDQLLFLTPLLSSTFRYKEPDTHRKLQKRHSKQGRKYDRYSHLSLDAPISWKELTQWHRDEGIAVDIVEGRGMNESQKNYLSRLYGSLIIPRVYLGSRLAATDRDWLEEHNITHILTIAEGLRPAFPKEYIYKFIPARDHQNQNLIEHFDSCSRFIEKALASEKGNVLIHWWVGTL